MSNLLIRGAWAAALTGALAGLPFNPAFAAVAPASPGASTAPDNNDEDLPDPGNHGRVRALEGVIRIESATDERVDEADLNSPVFEGDLVRTQDGARGEVQLADGSLVRIDDNTVVEFRSLIDPYGRYVQPTILRLSEGSVYLDVRGGDNQSDASERRESLFQVDTPAASVYIQTPGLFRVDVTREETRVTAASHRGTAEVSAEDGSVVIRSGQRTVVYPGESPGHPASFNSFAMDSFDRWNEDRVTYYARAGSDDRGERDDSVDYERLPSEVQPYSGELSRSGRWVYEPDYGQVWYPLGVGTSWSPYSYGSWGYGPYGSYWVSSEPWGWAPYHYGRWCHSSAYGWVWAPGSVYGGAWVSWYYGPSHIGWCPLDYWNRPAFINIGFYLGGWGYDPYCWNFCGYQQIHVKNVNKIVIKTPPGDIGRGVIVRRAVKLPPSALHANSAIGREKVLAEARRVHDREQARDRSENARGQARPITNQRASTPSASGEAPGRSFRENERGDLGRIHRGEVQRGTPRVRDGQTITRDSHTPQASGDQARFGAPVSVKPRAQDRTETPRTGPAAGPSTRGPSNGGARNGQGGSSLKAEPKTFAPRGVDRTSGDGGSGGNAGSESIRRLLRDADRPGTTEGEGNSRDSNPQGRQNEPRTVSPQRAESPSASQSKPGAGPRQAPPAKSGEQKSGAKGDSGKQQKSDSSRGGSSSNSNSGGNGSDKDHKHDN